MMIKYRAAIHAGMSVCSITVTLIWFLLAANPVPCLGANQSFDFLIEILPEKKENAYGKKGARRLEEWRKFILENRNKTDLEKVKTVNRFLNTMTSTLDLEQWNREDYWATPHQFIASGGGDCEDYAIAKYFTLRMMGITVDRIRPLS